MMGDLKIIVVHESWHLSAARDATSVLCAFAMIGPGWLMGSAAMQWAGFLFLCVVSMARATGLREKHERTLEEARDEIAAMIAARTGGNV